jgi:hypothetical protein
LPDNRFDPDRRGALVVPTCSREGVAASVAPVERLLGEDDSVVIVIELDPAALSWTKGHPGGDRAIPVVGDAADEVVAARAVNLV